MKSTHMFRLAPLVAGLAAASGAPAIAQVWSSTNVQLLRGTGYTEPFNPNDVSKTILTVENVSGWSWGKTFAFVDVAQSGRQEVGAFSGGAEAPTDVYGEVFAYASLSKLTGKSWAAGPVADVSLAVGINAGRKSSELKPRPRAYLAGLSFDAALPMPGFASVDVFAYSDHGGTAFGKPNYKTTYQITPAWGIPFEVGGMGFEFNGFVDIIGSRGQGTVRQVLAQPQLLVDVGRHFGMPKQAFLLGVEYQYWKNKFGIQGANEANPQILLKWKL